MNLLPFRHVHLDFHTSQYISQIGSQFDKAQFQQALQKGCVNAITLFSKCHHGYSYHQTSVGEMHPNLKFDLLQAQLEACQEIGVQTTVYISAGLDERSAEQHPEWLARNKDETIVGNKDFVSQAGYHVLCYNTPYFSLLLAQVKEVMERYHPTALFFDISAVRPCYCSKCRAEIKANGEDIRNEKSVMNHAEIVYKRYATQIADLIHIYQPDARIFHNAGHITRGRRDLAQYNTHLELESLPTGGWGYDHFPMSASYAMTLNMEYVGMTGKFHTSWGEFGGYKHPNALRYETALSLAFSAKCSIGDQLHPYGKMDMTTYDLIGKAYREVEQKEPWCTAAENIADVAVLSQESVSCVQASLNTRNLGDIGANKIMLEGKYLYHIIDTQADFKNYKVIILPDTIRLNQDLKLKLDCYLEQGGKVLATGTSGLKENEDEFALNFGVEFIGYNCYQPTYIRPLFDTINTGGAFVMYEEGYDVKVTGGKLLGYKENPFFNRDINTFCSHQHTPTDTVDAGASIVVTENTAYVAYRIFSDYAQKGELHAKEIIVHILDYLLGEEKTIFAKLPDRAIVTLTQQKRENRWINHILFAYTTKRGSFRQSEDVGGDIEVVESIVPLYDIPIKVKVIGPVRRVYLAPNGNPIEFNQQGDWLTYTVPCVECHQMVVIEY